MKRVIKFILGALLGLLVFAAVLLWAATQLLRAAPGEWSQPLRIGAWHVDASVTTLWRIATHPVTLRLLENRSVRTPYGVLQWRADAQPNTWRAVCAPCSVRSAELGHDAVQLTRVEFSVRRGGQSDMQGEFALGDAPRMVRGRWSAHVDAKGAELKFNLPDTPIADAYALFASAIPELSRARIDGRIHGDARLRLPAREWTIHPHVDGFAVAGLGTEALLDAVPTCNGKASTLKFGSWLPRAVIAAEDQRFYEHTGYDLAEMTAAWSASPLQGDAPRGASTLSQQLAKLVYTGDSRSHLRKLRELLYAVELDRTLGKGRVLNLYLAMVPWGEGQCGAQAASRHYLHKRVDALTPTEAAWLASLLHNPDRELAMLAVSGQVNVERVSWVINNLRPMPKLKREALVNALADWSPALH